MRQRSGQRPAKGCRQGGLHQGGGPSKIDVGVILGSILFIRAMEDYKFTEEWEAYQVRMVIKYDRHRYIPNFLAWQSSKGVLGLNCPSLLPRAISCRAESRYSKVHYTYSVITRCLYLWSRMDTVASFRSETSANSHRFEVAGLSS
jgi:hypothetical protein